MALSDLDELFLAPFLIKYDRPKIIKYFFQKGSDGGSSRDSTRTMEAQNLNTNIDRNRNITWEQITFLFKKKKIWTKIFFCLAPKIWKFYQNWIKCITLRPHQINIVHQIKLNFLHFFRRQCQFEQLPGSWDCLSWVGVQLWQQHLQHHQHLQWKQQLNLHLWHPQKSQTSSEQHWSWTGQKGGRYQESGRNGANTSGWSLYTFVWVFFSTLQLWILKFCGCSFGDDTQH